MSDNNLSKIFTDIPKLTGKENFVEWDHQLKLALLIIKASQFMEPNASPSEGSQSAWRERDGQLAGLILQSTATPILSVHLHLVIASLEISSPSAEKTRRPTLVELPPSSTLSRRRMEPQTLNTPLRWAAASSRTEFMEMIPLGTG
jgi:hypothetical protein